MELLWPNLDPEAALNNLHYALHVARRTLEASTLTSAASRYLLLRGEQLALCLDSPHYFLPPSFHHLPSRGSKPYYYGRPREERR